MIIAVDFDGTLCTHRYPNIGEEIAHSIAWIRRQQAKGTKLILWTCREGYQLTEAIAWCKTRGITFDAVNENVSSMKNKDHAIRKPYADIYFDDRNITLSEVQEDEQKQSVQGKGRSDQTPWNQ